MEKEIRKDREYIKKLRDEELRRMPTPWGTVGEVNGYEVRWDVQEIENAWTPPDKCLHKIERGHWCNLCGREI